MSTPLPIRAFGGFLFDMDGTILSSIASAERAWTVWAKRQGLDVEAFLPTIHGVQSVETIRRLNLPGIDPVAEAHALTEAEMLDVDDVVPIGGAAAFLAALPPDRWAIVTSAPKRLAEVRLKAAGLPLPGVFVTAEDAKRSKPAPDGFLLGAKRLGVAPEECLAFEDAPAGIAAAEAAGMTVVVITETHRGVMDTAHATVGDYRDLAVEWDGASLKLDHRV
ncbi:HAD-IA family hydrolase [Sphingomonas parapaucimobilis]|uniref:Putative phosphatase n=1 Tax=Sphingomonas parapaucimobilis NBRC 15100 TaxID=1219049 RepID=A0A0A1W6W0_9SPHN|nr:HAD-IA family hydrolase [Sphingomonas parapaucimobilis]GAM00654.1 putative phosphatase [Sphingomonas parapaucimobilis NBRC 15100]